jgi:imidazole glycerol-phosphate synthase subunit HisH
MSTARTDMPLRVSVFDYGAGNLHSLIKSLERERTVVRVDTDPTRAVADVDALVLPGVGAFSPAAAQLASGLLPMRAALRQGLPCLGICLGMQLLCDGSDEGPGEGLGVFPGRVTRLRSERVPQIGWNALDDVRDPLLTASGLTIAYFANSFVCRVVAGLSPNERLLADDASPVTAWSEHEGDRFPAVVRHGQVVGMQFHPEKSSSAGVRTVHAFLDAAARARQTRFLTVEA